MARAYYSLVLDDPADAVWAHIRSFGDYAWSGVDAEVGLDDGAAGDQVGAVRHIRGGGRDMRQRLLALSDVERSYTYEFADASPFPVHDYRATIRVTPVVEGDRAFVEWWATFDCEPVEQERWTAHFSKQGFGVWLAALRLSMAG
ncbi:MAG TPA: SRPBCC family protein [Acetobacteraceae bacterium]|jgi:hypothetical protein|nr:SRPBCC family protein [Acetobacteraceae bacterium]